MEIEESIEETTSFQNAVYPIHRGIHATECLNGSQSHITQRTLPNQYTDECIELAKISLRILLGEVFKKWLPVSLEAALH